MSDVILEKVKTIYQMYQNGDLGDTTLPEDSNPHLDPSTNENALYFTLPMALNYQRNSYTLWESALKTYEDPETSFVFIPAKVITAGYESVQKALTKYRLALQKNKQTDIWLKLCQTFMELSDGNIIKFINNLDNDVDKIRYFMQKDAKKKFPYLSGNKLCNYWLYVLSKYTTIPLKSTNNIYIAADRHVIRASYKLGLITKEQMESSKVQTYVINAWAKELQGTEFVPTDLQNPLWLLSRNDFKNLTASNARKN